jgi:hypothetical protein
MGASGNPQSECKSFSTVELDGDASGLEWVWGI